MHARSILTQLLLVASIATQQDDQQIGISSQMDQQEISDRFDGQQKQSDASGNEQDFQQRFHEFQKEDGKFVDMNEPVPQTEKDQEQVDDMPHKIARIRSKLTPFYVKKGRRDDLEQITAYNVMVEVFGTSFKTKHLEAIVPFPKLRIWSSSQQPVTIYVRDEEGYFVPLELSDGESHEIVGGLDGKVPFAVATETFWVDTNIIRLHVDGMPKDAVYTLSANLNTLGRLQSLSVEDLQKERADIKITTPHFKPDDAEAALKATNTLMRQITFAESHEVYMARSDPTVSGLETRLRPRQYRKYIDKYGRQGSSSLDDRPESPSIDRPMHRADQSLSDKSRRPEERFLDDEEQESNRKLFKRSFPVNGSDGQYFHAVQGDYHDWMDQHVSSPSEGHDPHWELSFEDDGQVVYRQHTAESVIERVAEHTGQSVEDVKQDHKLFKRDMRHNWDRSKLLFKGELRGDTKSMIVTEEGDELIVKILQKTGQVIRKVLKFVHQALKVVEEIFVKIGIAVRKMLEWMKSLFHWGSFLRALRVGTMHSVHMPVHAIDMIADRAVNAHEDIKEWKGKVIEALDKTIESLTGSGVYESVRAKIQNEAYDRQQEEDHQSTYLADVLNHAMVNQNAQVSCHKIPGMRDVKLSAIFERMFEQIRSRITSKLDAKQLKQVMGDSMKGQKLGQGLFAGAAATFLKFVRGIISELFDITQDLVDSINGEIIMVLNDLHHFMNCEFKFGPLTKLWHTITKLEGVGKRKHEAFTLASVALLPGSLAFVLNYKAHNHLSEPFDNHDIRALTAAQKPTDYMSVWTRCVQCRSLEELPLDKRINILSWLFGYHRIFMSALLSFHEPAQRILNKNAMIPLVAVKPIFHFMHHMYSFPFQSPDKELFNPVSVESWKFGLASLVFASSSAWGADIYDDAVRVMNVGLMVLDIQVGWSKEMSPRRSLNPSSGRVIHWKLKGLSDVMNSVPIMPGVAKLEQYIKNARMVSTILDKVRIHIDIYMNWRF